MKQWYFYDENGDVRIIYNIEPPHELLEQGNYIIAGKPAERFGYDMLLKVNIRTKELIVKYVVISSGGSSGGGGSIDTAYLDELNKKFDNAVLQGTHLKFYASGSLVKEIVLPTTGGESGQKGNDGVGLEFQWRGTDLGIKRTDQSSYTYVNLQGAKGDNGKAPEVNIGSNGNWYIDGRDTGKPSRGRDGSGGSSSGSGTDGKDGVSLDFQWSGTKLGIKRSDQYNYTYVDLQGKQGKDGVNGISLDFNWSGTSLGIKKSNESSYSYANLKGEKGDKGENGSNGKDGQTPTVTIGYNGNWYINGQDTGKPSRGKDGTSGSGSGTGGKDGKDGVSLDFQWSGTYLGVKREDQSDYTWKDLQGASGKNGVDGTNGQNGKDGKNGLSAYEIACQNGFKGSEQEWLASLHGKDGTDGAGGSVGDIQLKDITLDANGLKTLNEKIAYGHNHQGTQIVCSTKSWANNKYILEDIIDYLGTVIVQQNKDIEQLKKQISDIYITVQK